MRRRINFKLLIWLLVPIVPLGVGVHVLHAFQVNRSAGSLLERSRRLAEEGESVEALRYLSRYLGYRPDDAEAVAQYGERLAELARTPDDRVEAIMSLERALRLDPSRDEARRRIIDLAMDPQVQRFTDALAHLEYLEKAAPEDGELKYLRARCLEGQSKYAEAASVYAEAIEHEPDRVESYVQRAALLRLRLEAPAEADAVLDALVAANPKIARAHLERGLYRRVFQIDGASADIARALELAPDDIDVLLTAADGDASQGDWVQARERLEHALRQDDQDVRLYEALARVALREGDPDRAEAALRQGLQALTNVDEKRADLVEQRGTLHWSLAVLLVDEERNEPAAKVLDEMQAAEIRPELIRFLRARLLINDEEWAQARDELEAVRPMLVNAADLAYQANLLLGHCHERLGDTDRAAAAYRRAVGLDPERASGRTALARTQVALGKLDEAVTTLQPVAGDSPENRLTEARLLAEQARRQPEDRRDWSSAEQALERAEESDPDSIEVALLRAQLRQAQGRTDSARDVLIQARDQHPEEVRFWIALAGLADEAPAALATLDEARQSLGDRVELRLARAELAIQHSGVETLETLKALEASAEEFSPEDRDRLARGLIDAHRLIQDIDGARRLLDPLVQREPKNLGLRLIQFDLAFDAGDEAALKDVHETLKAIEGESGVYWRYATARILVRRASRADSDTARQESLREARRVLAEIDARRPDWPAAALIKGQVDDALGRTEAAALAYQQAIDHGERRPEVVKRAAQLLVSLGRVEEAGLVLDKLVGPAGDSDDPELLRLSADVALREGDRPKALVLARQAVSADSEQAGDLLWLAGVLASTDEPKEAEAVVRQAIAIDGSQPEGWSLLLNLLVRDGRQDEALEAMEQARGKLAEVPGRLLQAQGRMLLGQTEAAAAEYQAALEAGPDDPDVLRNAAAFALTNGQTEEAEARLRRLAALKPSTTEAEQAATWGRRLLALTLATRSGQQHFAEALSLVGLPEDLDGYRPPADAPLEILRDQAKVLALRQEPASRRAAIRLLEQVVQRDPSARDDRFTLAQLYRIDRDWPKLRDQMQSLLALRPDDANLIGFFAQSLLTEGDLDGAGFWLARLERLEPGTERTVAIQGRLLKARGRDDEAVSAIQSFAEGHEDRWELAARWLIELDLPSAAEPYCRQLMAQSDRPTDVLRLADCLARQGRLGEALDLCEKLRDRISAELTAGVVLSLLYTTDADAATLQQADRLVAAALQSQPDSITIQFQLANLRSLQERYDEAEKLYRLVMARDPGNSGPLNNLAWLRSMRGDAGQEPLQLIESALALGGPSPDLLDTRALVYLAQKRGDLALSDLDEALKRDPDAPLLYLHRAQARLATGALQQANDDLKAARAKGLQNAVFHPLDRAAYERLEKALAAN